MAGNRIADLEIYVKENCSTAVKHVTELTEALTQLKKVASTMKDTISLSSSFGKMTSGAKRTTQTLSNLNRQIQRSTVFTAALKNALESVNTARGESETSVATENSSILTNATRESIAELEKATKSTNILSSSTDHLMDSYGNIRALGNFIYKLDTMGLHTKTATSRLGKLISQFGRLMKVKLMRLAITQIIQGISEGFKNVYYWSQLTGGSFDDLVDSVYSSLGQMKNQIGSVASELFTAIAPALQAIIGLVIRVANELARLIAFVNGASTYRKAINQGLQYGSALDGVGSSAGSARKEVEELQRTILGFDELNVLNAPNEKSSGGGSGGGAGGGGTNYADMFEEVPIGQMNALEKGLAGIFGIFKDLIGLGGQGINLFDAIFGWFETGNTNPLADFMDEFGDFISNLSPWAKAVWDWGANMAKGLQTGFIYAQYGIKKAIDAIKTAWVDVRLFILETIKDMLDNPFWSSFLPPALKNYVDNIDADISALRGEREEIGKNTEAWLNEELAETEAYYQSIKTGEIFHQTANILRGSTLPAINGLSTPLDTLRSKLGLTNTTADGSNEKLLTLRDRLDAVREKLGGASTNAQVYNTKMEKLKGVTDSATKSTDTAKNSFKGVGDKISIASVNLDNFISKKPLLERMKGTFDNMADSMDTLASKLKRVKDNLDGLSHVNVFNSVKYNGINVTVEKYAEGGFPTTGELFVANESGAELIGSMNGRTAVASNGEITGIREAVIGGAETEARLLREQNSLLRQLLSKDSTIGVSTINTAQNRLNRRAGVALT